MDYEYSRIITILIKIEQSKFLLIVNYKEITNEEYSDLNFSREQKMGNSTDINFTEKNIKFYI